MSDFTITLIVIAFLVFLVFLAFIIRLIRDNVAICQLRDLYLEMNDKWLDLSNRISRLENDYYGYIDDEEEDEY